MIQLILSFINNIILTRQSVFSCNPLNIDKNRFILEYTGIILKGMFRYLRKGFGHSFYDKIIILVSSFRHFPDFIIV